MPPRRPAIPLPQKAIRFDLTRFVYGGLFILLGIAILVRAISEGSFSSLAILGLMLIAFGIYRLYVDITRYRKFQDALRKSREIQKR